jgi:hypothetical protein
LDCLVLVVTHTLFGQPNASVTVRESAVTVREIVRVGQFRAVPRFGYGSDKESVPEVKCLGYGAGKSGYGAGIRWNTPAYWRVLRTLFG